MTIKWKRDEFTGYVSEAGRVWNEGPNEWVFAPAHKPNSRERWYRLREAKKACEEAHQRELYRNNLPSPREILDWEIERQQATAQSVGDFLQGGQSFLLLAALRQCRSCLVLDAPLVEALVARWKAAQR
jgi:hypothetical protein